MSIGSTQSKLKLMPPVGWLVYPIDTTIRLRTRSTGHYDDRNPEGSMDTQAVGQAIRRAAAREVVPRFRRLAAGDVNEKSPGDIVTVADLACEVALGESLRRIQDIPVVGEEATAADPSVAQALSSEPAVWVIDPIDGTSNFAAGSADYAVMVAYVEQGQAQASWIWQPSHNVMASATRGRGAHVNGERVRLPEPKSVGLSVGVVKDRFLPEQMRERVAANAANFGAFVPGASCAGVDYPSLTNGKVDFLFYWRTLVWDHAPGVLFATEAGASAIRPSGEPYRSDDETGLLVAHERVAEEVLERLVGPK